MDPRKKFAVHYESPHFGNSYLHIFATSVEDARTYVVNNGVGFDGTRTVYPTKITSVVCVENRKVVCV